MTDPGEGLPRAVLFDWDNTLVDTWPVIIDAINTTLVAMGHAPWTTAEAQARVARSLRESFPPLFGDRWEEAREVFYDRFRSIHLAALSLLPGAEALLEALAGRQVYLAVVSNKSGNDLRREAAHLGVDRYFGRLVGALDAAEDKPAVAPVTLALAGSGIAPGPHVWLVGDSAIDAECAWNAGCTAVLVRQSPPLATEFTGGAPKMHFRACAELAALVATL